jgi:hypothetical protein
VGNTQNQRLTLTINIGYDPGSAPDIVPVSNNSPNNTKYALQVTFPDNSTTTIYNQGGVTINTDTEPRVVPGHYEFLPTAYNWVGPTAGSSSPWDTLAGGPGGVGPLKLDEMYTWKDATDPNFYAMTYWVPYYIQGNYANLGEVYVAINNALKTHLQSLGLTNAFECIEVDYYNERNQGWDICGKDLDETSPGVFTPRLYYRFTNNISHQPGDFTWGFDDPDNPNTAASPAVNFTQGAYVFLGFGKIRTAKELDGNYREQIATYSAPLQLSTPFEWNP